jgi:hypothetical protein
VTPEKMIDIHRRMLEIHALLRQEFGGRVGMTINGASGPSTMPAQMMGFEPGFNVTFVFQGDGPDRSPTEPPACFSGFGERKGN